MSKAYTTDDLSNWKRAAEASGLNVTRRESRLDGGILCVEYAAHDAALRVRGIYLAFPEHKALPFGEVATV